MGAPLAEENARDDRMIAWSAIAGGVCVFMFGLYIAFGRGYESRRQVTLAIAEAADLRESLSAFHRKEKRWPRFDEAPKFRVDPARLKSARSVAYDPGRRAVVVTLARDPHAGKSFAFVADAATPPRWSCKTIDLELKYLPDSCR